MSKMRGFLGAATPGLSPQFIISDQIRPCDHSRSQERDVILPLHLSKRQSVVALVYPCTHYAVTCGYTIVIVSGVSFKGTGELPLGGTGK